MAKFDTWSIKCRLCDWEWETKSSIMAHNPRCNRCGSLNCDVIKKELIAIKKQGKFIDNFEFDILKNDSVSIDAEIISHSVKTDDPLVVIRKTDCRLADNLSDEDREFLIGKIDFIKSRLVGDLVDNIKKKDDKDLF